MKLRTIRVSILRFSAATVLSVVLGCKASPTGEWAVVSKGDIAVSVELSGSLSAVESTSVGPPSIESMWQFKIAAIVKEGTIIGKGDLLVAFDSSDLVTKRTAKENQRKAAKEALKKRKIELSMASQDALLALVEAEAALRKATLGANQSADLTANLTIEKSKIDFAAALENVDYLRAKKRGDERRNKSALRTLAADLKQASLALAQLDADIASMTIKATSSGTTVVYNADDKPTVGSSIWQMRSVLKLASLDRMIGEGIVDEADMSKLVVGQKVRFRLESEPDQELTGIVTEIGTSLHPRSQAVPSQVIDVKFSINPAGELTLRPGMRFRGGIEIASIKQVTLAPLSSVFPSPVGPVAFVSTPDGVSPRALVLGERGKRNVHVLKGISPGDRVSRFDPRLDSQGARQ